MTLVSCVHAAALPLQLLALRLRTADSVDHGDPRARIPIAVVDKDKPLGRVLAVNAAARAQGVKEGMRYGEALSLVSALRAGVVREDELKAAHLALHQMLMGFSPEVEPKADEPGTFWLNASGLKRLFGTRERWSQAIRDTVAQHGFCVRVVVGERRFDVYCLARAGPRFTVPEAVPLHALMGGVAALDVATVQELALLGIHSVGDLAQMPLAPLQERYPRLAQWWAQAQAEVPLQAVRQAQRYAERMQFEPPDADSERLLFACKHLLARVLPRLASERLAVSTLRLEWGLERRVGGQTAIETIIEPAQPVLLDKVLIDLLRLKLESLVLPVRVFELRLEAVAVPATTEQLALFNAKQARSLEGAQRALARVRAALGDVAGVAVVRAFHAPERQFEWEAVSCLTVPRETLSTPTLSRQAALRQSPPRAGVADAISPTLLAQAPHLRAVTENIPPFDAAHAAAGPLLVRRLWSEPRKLAQPPQAAAGPYRVASGWGRMARDYYYARQRG